MAQQNVVDELVVKLTLDAEGYRKVEAKVENETDRTFRKQQERGRKTERQDKDQQRRLRDISGGVKAFAGQVMAAVGVVTGLGVALGASLTGFLNFETGLRRQTVGTALSNRQMQAWGATARRLGADASAGAEAIAALAKERQQFNLGVPAPTLAALGKMGVNVDPARPLEDVLSQAQTIYRGAPAGQQQQYENTLSAQGVSNDLILMIKSERDVREAFTQSFSQAAEENRKALDKLADAYESIKATAIQVSATLLEALQPAIAEGAIKLSEFAVGVAKFTRDVNAAGGGAQGFKKALDDNVPSLGHAFEGFMIAGRRLSETTDILAAKNIQVASGFDRLLGWLNTVRAPWGEKGLVDDVTGRVRGWVGAGEGQTLGEKMSVNVSDWWDNLVNTSRNTTKDNPDALPAPVEMEGVPLRRSAPLPAPVEMEGVPVGRAKGPPALRGDAQTMMATLITKHGLQADEAAAVVANLHAESGLRANAVNPVGGGTGARGLAQWRGARTEAFAKRYGMTPDKASVDQQLEFMMTDPYERTLLMKSLRAGGTAAEKGQAVSQYYEAHGNVQKDKERGVAAQRLADAFPGRTGGAAGTTISIANVNVTANEPAAFVGGIQRIADTQNYNSVQR